MGDRIEAIFRSHRRRYGYRRIQSELSDEGLTCSPAPVRRLIQERGLKAIQPLTCISQTSDGRADLPSQPSPRPTPAFPAQPSLGRRHHLYPTSTGWLYLAVVIGLCSRRIVGWALADHLKASLVCDALQQALGSRPLSKAARPIFYRDRGSPYGSGASRQLLQSHHLRQSRFARANPYHNAWTESFRGTLKAEMLQGGAFIDAHDARPEIFAYLVAYYNPRRKHSAPAYRTPFQFESRLVQRTIWG